MSGPTTHNVHEADARYLHFIETESAHLVCTSPPYAMLMEYPDHPGQMGKPLGSGVPWCEFIDALAIAYEATFRSWCVPK